MIKIDEEKLPEDLEEIWGYEGENWDIYESGLSQSNPIEGCFTWRKCKSPKFHEMFENGVTFHIIIDGDILIGDMMSLDLQNRIETLKGKYEEENIDVPTEFVRYCFDNNLFITVSNPLEKFSLKFENLTGSKTHLRNKQVSFETHLLENPYEFSKIRELATEYRLRVLSTDDLWTTLVTNERFDKANNTISAQRWVDYAG